MSSSPRPAASPSAVDAASDAMALVGVRLFPFRFERWLALGFVAFLDQCGRTGGGSPGSFRQSFNRPLGSSPRAALPDFSPIASWAGSHLGLLVLLTLVGLGVIVLLSALVLWISTRGIFMYIDDVATGRAEVARPWREHAEQASSLFAWRFGLGLVTLVVFLLTLAALALLFVSPSGLRSFSLGRGLAAGFLILIAIAIGLLAGLIALALRDFVAPLQWRLRLACVPAARLVIEMIASRPGTFVVYLLLKIVFAVVLAVVSAVLCCVTCCCGMLPVVFQTIAQPAFYFERAWSLFLLQQFGYDVIEPEPYVSPLAAGV